MDITIIGAGAVGGMLGALLASHGHEVSVVEKGARYLQIRENGLTVTTCKGATFEAKVTAFDYIPKRKTEVVILALKSYDLPRVVPQLSDLLDRDSFVLTVQNGLPWWYFHKHGGGFEPRVLRSVDPNGSLCASVDPDRILGGVFYPACCLESSGRINHIEGWGMPVGELDGSLSQRATSFADVLIETGFKSRAITDIRSELWLKAIGSATFNPMSVLTDATMVELCEDPASRALITDMMEELSAIASKLNITFRRSIEQRIAGAKSVGDHRTSMLMDFKNNQPLESEGIIGVMLELAEMVDIKAPSVKSIYELLKFLERKHGPVLFTKQRAKND